VEALIDGEGEAPMIGTMADESTEQQSALTLTAPEAAALKLALKSYITGLRSEIGHTERYEFREELKHERALLEGVLRRLGEEPTNNLCTW